MREGGGGGKSDIEDRGKVTARVQVVWHVAKFRHSAFDFGHGDILLSSISRL